MSNNIYNERDDEVTETLPLNNRQNQLLSYLDTTFSIVQILHATGWFLSDDKWKKGPGAVVNKKGFMELRRILFSMLHPNNQLSVMHEDRIEEQVCSMMKTVIVQFAVNLKDYGIPDIETFHTLMAQIRINLHFHFMKSVKGQMLKALTQQIQTIYNVQGSMEKQNNGMLKNVWNRLKGKNKEEKNNEMGTPI